jgi:hypothetical protein
MRSDERCAPFAMSFPSTVALPPVSTTTAGDGRAASAVGVEDRLDDLAVFQSADRRSGVERLPVSDAHFAPIRSRR